MMMMMMMMLRKKTLLKLLKLSFLCSNNVTKVIYNLKSISKVSKKKAYYFSLSS